MHCERLYRSGRGRTTLDDVLGTLQLTRNLATPSELLVAVSILRALGCVKHRGCRQGQRQYYYEIPRYFCSGIAPGYAATTSVPHRRPDVLGSSAWIHHSDARARVLALVRAHCHEARAAGRSRTTIDEVVAYILTPALAVTRAELMALGSMLQFLGCTKAREGAGKRRWYYTIPSAPLMRSTISARAGEPGARANANVSI